MNYLYCYLDFLLIAGLVILIFFALADVGSFLYGEGHPMRPFRITMTH